MGLLERLSALQQRADEQLDVLNSKRKTENALLLPFFDALGYDPFNVREVEPQYAVEVEGVGSLTADYAVKIDGAPAMLFRCTEAGADLAAVEDSLLQYLDALGTSLVAHSNGIRYRFYADLEEGRADRQPFFEFNLLDFESKQARYLQRFTETAFETDEVLAAAFELKYTRLLQNYLARQRESPDQHFVRFLAAQIYDGEISEGVLDRFHPLVQRLFRQLEMQERNPGPVEQPPEPPELENENRVEVTNQRSGSGSGPEDTANLDPHLQRAPAGLSEIGEQKTAIEDSEAPSSDPIPETDGPRDSEEDSHAGAPASSETENGEPTAEQPGEEELETNKTEGKEPEDEEPEDERLDRGSSIAQAFADKVIGDS
jgi:predicted type IV restriction endonuclease